MQTHDSELSVIMQEEALKILQGIFKDIGSKPKRVPDGNAIRECRETKTRPKESARCGRKGPLEIHLGLWFALGNSNIL